MKKLFILSFFTILSLLDAIKTINNQYITDNKINKISSKYGVFAKKRVEAWDKMLQKTKDEKIFTKLKNVNDFFNQIPYKTDRAHWKKNDYWATPFEFMGTNAGDCEDYAIAKYDALRKLGVPEEKLKLVYVIYNKRGTKYDQAHMVLTYSHKANSTPIVLDIINKKLTLANKRKDLKPIYSFNANGLWQAKNKGSVRVGKNNLKAWKSVMSRY